MSSIRHEGRPGAPFLLRVLLIAAASLGAGQASAATPRLSQPIDCNLGKDCYIQQYVDRDTGPNQRDVGCGRLANDGHKGTDFAIPSLTHMQAGVRVLAAAEGIVRGVRDGMPDIDATSPNAPNLKGRECGNGVVIEHGDDWETQYCHLRKGSVQVKQGQKIRAGETLGLVGMSGEATFPHVHFSVRQSNHVVDPFNPNMTEACGLAGNGLWNTAPSYRPGGLLAIGVSDSVPDYEQVKSGLPENALPGRAPTAIVLWGYAFAGETGDVIEISVSGPDGFAQTHQDRLTKRQPFFYRAYGKKAPATGFPKGRYTGSVRLLRGSSELDRQSLTFQVR